MIGAALLGRSVPAPSPRSRPASNPQVIRRLVPGTSGVHALRGGGSHVYDVHLSVGQVLQAEVVQQGIDVEVLLLGPGGEVLLGVDSPNNAYGPEPVFAVTSEAGEHRLAVTTSEGTDAEGRYLLHVEPLRPATPRDRIRASATRAFSAGEGYRRAGGDEGLRKAIQEYGKALRLWEALGDTGQQATTLSRLGRVRQSQGRSSEALPLLLRALRLCREPGEQAVILNRLVDVYSSLGEPQKGVEACQRALALIQKTGGRPILVAGALENLGKLHKSWGKIDEASEYIQAALVRYREAGTAARSHQASSLMDLGEIQLALGRPRRALDFCQQALSLRQALGDQLGEAWSLRCVGMAFHQAGMEGIAAQYLERAVDKARLAGGLKAWAAALNDLGSIHLQAGRTDDAQEAFSEARKAHQEAGDIQGQLYANLGLASVRDARGDVAGALQIYSQAAAIAQRSGDRYGLVATLYRQALLDRKQGRTKEALARVEEVLNLTEVLRREVGNLGQRSSFSGSRFSYYESYIDFLMQLHAGQPDRGYDVRAFEASERFRAPALLEGLSEVRAAASASVPPELRWRQTTLEQRLEELLRKRLQVASEPADPPQRERLARVEGDIRDLLDRLGTVRKEIQESSPHYGVLVQPQPATLRQVQELLDEDTALVSYLLGQERSHVWWIERDSITSRELAGRAIIESAARSAHVALARAQLRAVRADLPRTLGRLRRLVLDPLADRLGTKKFLLVVPDGALQLVPFGVLTPDGSQEPLVASHVMAYLPSASTPVILRRQRVRRPPARKLIAVLADPVFGLDDPRTLKDPERGEGAWSVSSGRTGSRRVLDVPARLPYSRREAESILGLVPTAMSSRFLDFDASRSTAMSPVLRQHRYLHFATHGILDPRQPELSGILLSRFDRRGRPRNGLLRFYEVYNMDLPAELVSLGACRSAVGAQVRGEGMVGMTRSFLYAGASRVVGSLWDVNDQSTAELMIRLYRRILKEGKPPAVALQEAQVSMMRDEPWRSPYHWAGFVLQGEWR